MTIGSGNEPLRTKGGGEVFVYVIGKLRDETDTALNENIELAVHTGLQLAVKGHIPFIHHKNFESFNTVFTHDELMELRISVLERCDAVFVMSSAKRSKSSQEEERKAREKGKIVFTSLQEV